MSNQLSLLFFASILFVNSSCTDNKKAYVVGKWIPVEVDKKYILSYQLSVDDLKNLSKNATIEFTKDGKFDSYSPHDTAHGIYNYDEKGKRLITATDGGKTEYFSVDLLEKNKMVVGNEFGRVTFQRE